MRECIGMRKGITGVGRYKLGGKRLGERIRKEDLLKQCIIQNTIMK